ncbi:MAG: hypothetical protein K0Q73_7199 [Paenibacillus sp.]|jgi:hypothetical protein|nr:hypothetical protein [Paenibacillus sp.]
MRKEIENPMIKPERQSCSLDFQEKLAEYERPVMDMDRFRKIWNDRVRREEAAR